MRLGVGCVQCVVFHSFDETERTVGVFGELSQSTMFTGAQVHIHVPESGQGRHQFDAVVCAVFVQEHDVVGRERVSAAPRFAELAESEGMFHVQLELVVLIQPQLVDEPGEERHRRHTPARHVKTVGAHRERRLVLDMQAGQGPRGLPDHLPQCLHAVPQSAFAATTHGDGI